MGDFNSILHPNEKSGVGAFNSRAGAIFSQGISDCNLIDLGFKGPMFTWKSGSLCQRLDWALGNPIWQDLFPNSSIINLPLATSDHCGVWVNLEGATQPREGSFKFLGPWLAHEDFNNQLLGAWIKGGYLD